MVVEVKLALIVVHKDGSKCFWGVHFGQIGQS